MGLKDKASSFLEGLVDSEELAKLTETPEVKSDCQMIVHYPVDNQPDVVYAFFPEPEDGIPYIKRYGYWLDGKFNKVETNNCMIKQSLEEFLNNTRYIPNKNLTKVYNSEEEFLLEML